jgi:hypothetical protein
MPENTNYTPEEPKDKVIKGTAKLEKKSAGKKVIDFLFSDKLDAIGNYLGYYILGPSLKELIFKLVTGATQMALFGGNAAVTNNTNSNYIPGYGYQPGRRDPLTYNNASNPGYAQPIGYQQQRVALGDISFDTKDDAWLVLDRMGREIQRYGKVRVADYYNFAGVTGQESNWALQSSGWYMLGDAHPMMRTDGRWVIEFPPVQSLR